MAALCLLGCVPDLGDLSESPLGPPSEPEPLFVPLEAGALPTPSPTGEPSSMPSVPSAVPTPVSPGSIEPTGEGSLTLLHGVVDAPSLSFCVVLTREGVSEVSEWPAPSGGLNFGHRVVLPMRDAFVPESTDVLVIALSGSPALPHETCETLLSPSGYAFDGVFSMPSSVGAPTSLDAGAGAQLDAGALLDTGALPATGAELDAGALSDAGSPRETDDAASLEASAPAPELPALRVAEVSRLLARSLEDRSYLLVANGCLGAPGLRHEQEDMICGAGYSERRSTLGGAFFPLSRQVDFGTLGLQFANASQSFPNATVRSNPGTAPGLFFTVASNVLLGNIAPYSARRSISVEDLGEPIDDILLDISTSPTEQVVLSVPWREALTPSAVELRNNSPFTLVLVGPSPLIELDDEYPVRWWNEPTVVATESRPPLE